MTRFLLVLAGLLMSHLVLADTPDPTDHVLGKPDAPITIIEYALMTCPHCADFNKTILPEIKRDYIDTGKAKLVFRDFPLDQLAVKGAMLARCAPSDRYFAFIDTLFANQGSWAASRDPVAALSRIARLGGLSEDQFNKCMADKSVEDAVLAQRIAGSKEFNVEATPTIIINGKKVDQAHSYADYDRILKAAS